ncbi:MAG: hypothetical protein OSJ76_00430 [Alphaproteobacteria bacterium]|nr:hypothetical protein [Alphaproteobacteria bacterium]
MENINLGTVQAPYLQRTLTIAPGGIATERYVFDSFNLLSASVDNVLEVTFGGAAVQSRFSGGMGYKLSAPVSYVQLFNTGDVPLEVTFALGIGAITDNRLTVSGTVNTSTKLAGYSHVRAGSLTAPQTLDYDNNSVVALVCTAGQITVNIAAAGVAVTDLTLSTGQAWEMSIVTGGSIEVTGTGQFNYSIAGY